MAITMVRYEDKVFEREHVVLDDAIFINCTFKESTLEYSGGDIVLSGCTWVGSGFIWRGRAAKMMGLLTILGMVKPPDQKISIASQLPV